MTVSNKSRIFKFKILDFRPGLESIYLKVQDYSLINSLVSLHEVLAKPNFEGQSSEVQLPSRAQFVICLVERGFISKAKS